MSRDYLLQHEHVGIKKAKHGFFMFNRNDNFIGRSLDLYGEWGEKEITPLLSCVRPGDTVLDIGANIGTHTVAIAHKVGPTGRVYAFEPQRRIFQMLCGNVAVNALNNVWTYQKGVSERVGEMVIPE